MFNININNINIQKIEQKLEQKIINKKNPFNIYKKCILIWINLENKIFNKRTFYKYINKRLILIKKICLNWGYYFIIKF